MSFAATGCGSSASLRRSRLPAWPLRAPVLPPCCQDVACAHEPHPLEHSPRIVNIASTEGLGGSAGNSPYTAAKHGIIGLTKGLAIELGKQGITVNAVCPGPIHTGITELIPDEHKATFAHRRTALRRYGEPEEVAHITLSLCLPAASYITGVAIPVDGGMRARNN